MQSQQEIREAVRQMAQNNGFGNSYKTVGFFTAAAKSPTVIMANYIHYDGIGDFNHLMDIMGEFIIFADKLGIKVVPLVICPNERRQIVINKIEERWPGLQPFIFTADMNTPYSELTDLFRAFVDENKKLQKMLGRALSIFQVSTATTKEQKDFLLTFCQADIPIVNISEHCGLRTSAMFSPISKIDERDLPVKDLKNINDRWMGLENETYCHGIKIKEPLAMTKAEAILTLENSTLMHALLSHSASQQATLEDLANEFLRTDQLIPAYLQSRVSIMKFIYFCLEQPSMANSNLSFYINNFENLFSPLCKATTFSQKEIRAMGIQLPAMIAKKGCGVRMPTFEFLLLKNPYFHQLKTLGIGKIEINLNGNCRTIVIDPDDSTKRTIRIFSDFNLNDHDYDSLFHIANSIVGISGDNTLEKALSHNKLPVLQSEQKYSFEQSMRMLGELAVTYLPSISPEAKEDLERFFMRKNMRFDEATNWSELLKVDVNALLAHWETVVTELRLKHNLYNNLDHIFYESLLHMSATKGDIALLHAIYKHFPEIDFTIPNKLGKTVQTVAEENRHENYLRELEKLMGLGNTQSVEMTFERNNTGTGMDL